MNFKCRSDSWERVECTLCESHLKTSVFLSDAENGNIVRCIRCGLAYRNPRRPEEHFSNYFQEKWTETFAIDKKFRTYILNKISKWILEYCPFPSTILDIGSSDGELLSYLPESWSRFGVDPSKSACRVAKNIVPTANIINDTFTNTNLENIFFDITTIISTIYYLPHPLRDLSKIKGLLKHGGIVLIESWNFSNRGYIYRWLKKGLGKKQIYFYNPKTIEKIVNKSGMRVVDRIDLPGHGVISSNIAKCIIYWLEFIITKLIRKLTFERVDLVPWFVLVVKTS
jgi:SAM-dependent methyltransferase